MQVPACQPYYLRPQEFDLQLLSDLISRMQDSGMTRDSFKQSHGKFINGCSYTYKELEQTSWLDTIKNVGCTAILIGLFIFCLISIYEVDIKKGSHDDVLAKIEKISNFTVSDFVNGTVQATNQLGSYVQESLKVGQAKRAQLNDWVSNKSSELLNQISTTAQKKQEVIDGVLNIPRRIFEAIVEFYNRHIKGESVEQEVVEIEKEIEDEIEELDKEEVVEINQIVAPVVEINQVVAPVVEINQVVAPVVEAVIESSEQTEK